MTNTISTRRKCTIVEESRKTTVREASLKYGLTCQTIWRWAREMARDKTTITAPARISKPYKTRTQVKPKEIKPYKKDIEQPKKDTVDHPENEDDGFDDFIPLDSPVEPLSGIFVKPPMTDIVPETPKSVFGTTKSQQNTGGHQYVFGKLGAFPSSPSFFSFTPQQCSGTVAPSETNGTQSTTTTSQGSQSILGIGQETIQGTERKNFILRCFVEDPDELRSVYEDTRDIRHSNPNIVFDPKDLINISGDPKTIANMCDLVANSMEKYQQKPTVLLRIVIHYPFYKKILSEMQRIRMETGMSMLFVLEHPHYKILDITGQKECVYFCILKIVKVMALCYNDNE